MEITSIGANGYLVTQDFENLELLHGHCHDIKHAKGIYSRPNN